MLKKTKKFNKSWGVDEIKQFYYDNDPHYRWRNKNFNILSGVYRTTHQVVEDELFIDDFDFEQMALAKDKLRMKTEGRGF